MKRSFWLLVGSQTLYGDDVLKTVDERAKEMTLHLNESGKLPYEIIYKGTAKSNAEISSVIKEANYDAECAGIITWCHTFSPSKMWINGLASLQKPYCHLATQYNKEIPGDEIDMDFMNLNQAAHGDREHGFIVARLRIPRKVIAGYWQNDDVIARLGGWMRSAVGVAVSREMKVMRFGDNMREVAVTEGDKVEVQAKLGWQVNTWAVGDLVKEMNSVTEEEIAFIISGWTGVPVTELTKEESQRLLAMEATIKIIINDGTTIPSVATNAPKIPPCDEPTNVAIFTAIGPGVDSDIAIILSSSSSVSHPVPTQVS